MNQRNIHFYMKKGVTIISPENTYIEKGVKIGKDTIIYPFTCIEKKVTIGRGCRIGPFCKIRVGSQIQDGAVIGSFVEIVRSKIGKRTFIKHLSYIGDAEVGNKVNIGAGTITANFDGRRKHKTKIGNQAFIGCDTVLIAPVSVGEGAETGAGTVVPKKRNVAARTTVVGVPARLLTRRKS